MEERFIKRCLAISEKVLEETSELEGEWLTVADMEALNFPKWHSLEFIHLLVFPPHFLPANKRLLGSHLLALGMH